MFTVNDALDGIYLGCFFFGLLFTVGLLAFGAADIGADADADGEVGFVNVTTILTFLAWFGGVGYLVRHATGLAAVVSILLAIVAGLAGAALIAWVLKKLKASERVMDPRDYELPGTLARVTSSIRAGGVGEVVYEQQGVRQVTAARSADGRAIGRGTEVVILQTAGGFALVQPFDELLAEREEREREPDRLPMT
jgi:membrane protein implicated in regulation of membrane protease activity